MKKFQMKTTSCILIPYLFSSYILSFASKKQHREREGRKQKELEKTYMKVVLFFANLFHPSSSIHVPEVRQ